MVNVMCVYILWLGAATVIAGFLVNDGLIKVRAPAGEIVGTTQMVYVNGGRRQVQTFTGVPYAVAPIGPLRFRKPLPKPTFSTPFDATKQGHSCYNQSPPDSDIYGDTYSEDCLILNVITPDPAPSANYPVMVWIHGGGFVYGSSIRYDARGLSAFGDVIVITVNYRLSAYGFLSTGDYNSPGNFGLWDQQLAIQWVNKNIAAFGGDTSRVTIFGESAGSASVIYQAIYPGNKGLFQRVIAQSGSITGGWPFTKKDIMAGQSRKLAEYAGCNQVMVADYIACLRHESSKTLNETFVFAMDHGINHWSPVLDHAFVLDDPANIMDGSTTSVEALEMFRSVDLLIGANSAEGLVYLNDNMDQLNITDMNNLHLSRDSYETVEIPRMLGDILPSDKYNSGIAKAATIFEYTDWVDPDNELKRLKNLCKMQADYAMYVPTAQTAKFHTSSNSSTYVYLFATQPTYHLIPVSTQLDGAGVMNHADDLPFVFGYERMLNREGVNYMRNSNMRKVSNMVMTMWSNFAKTGNTNLPIDIQTYTNTAWPEYTATTEKFLEITPTMTPASVQQRYFPRAVEFWKSFLPSEILT